MREDVTEFKPRVQRAHAGHQKPRLQMRYLLASGHAHSRQKVARLLGVHRNSSGRWLALYATEDRTAVLSTDVPAGQPVSLAPAVLARLERALRRPEGVVSYEARRHWVRRPPGVEVADKTLYTIVRRRFRAKRKVPRPRRPKKA
jgi:hypothetical protein